MTPVGLAGRGHCAAATPPMRNLDTPRFPGCFSGTAARKSGFRNLILAVVLEKFSLFLQKEKQDSYSRAQVNFEKF